jgi:hypothetical protein
MKVTKVMKVTFPNYDSGEGAIVDAMTQESANNEGRVTVTTKRGRQVTPPGRYDPTTGKMVTWNVTAAKVDVESKKTVNMDYYDIFNVTGSAEITTVACCGQSQFFCQVICYLMLVLEWEVGGGFENTQD